MSIRYVVVPLVEVYRAAEKVDSWLLQVPFYRIPRDLILDTLLGPAEDLDYVSTTTPRTPPPRAARR